MGLPSVLETGRSAMTAAKTQVATSGHNIANANREGYSRQRVTLKTQEPHPGIAKGTIGRGVLVDRVERFNDVYLEKQLRNGSAQLQNFEEKDFVLRSVEDVFNELDGEGLNRIMAKFFNEFRALANEPESEAVRQAVREASNALGKDFKRIRKQLTEIQRHIDSRLAGYATEANSLSEEVRALNVRIKAMQVAGGDPNDLLDQRDIATKKLNELMDITVHNDEAGAYNIAVKGVAPLVTGIVSAKFSTQSTKADEFGKPEGGFELHLSGAARSDVTRELKGGKMGALISARDETLSRVIDRLDALAFDVAKAVNEIHRQGVTRDGRRGVDFFRMPTSRFRAADRFELSDDVRNNAANIAAGATPGAPGDNRIAVAISGLQHLAITNDGRDTADDFFNAMVTDVGVVAARNKDNLSQQKGIVQQLEKMKDNLVGVSIDEETANILKYQHAFDASAKVMQVANQMLDTVLTIGT